MGRKVSLQVNSRSTNCRACADVDDMTRIREDAAELVIVFLKKSKEYECWTDGAAQTNLLERVDTDSRLQTVLKWNES